MTYGTISALVMPGETAKGRAAQRLKVGRGSSSGGESVYGGRDHTASRTVFIGPEIGIPTPRVYLIGGTVGGSFRHFVACS